MNNYIFRNSCRECWAGERKPIVPTKRPRDAQFSWIVQIWVSALPPSVLCRVEGHSQTTNYIISRSEQKEMGVEMRKPVTDQETHLFKPREQEKDFAPLWHCDIFFVPTNVQGSYLILHPVKNLHITYPQLLSIHPPSNLLIQPQQWHQGLCLVAESVSFQPEKASAVTSLPNPL